jgi:hypothetical protein
MLHETILITGVCFIQKIYAPSSSLLQGKHLPSLNEFIYYNEEEVKSNYAKLIKTLIEI